MRKQRRLSSSTYTHRPTFDKDKAIFVTSIIIIIILVSSLVDYIARFHIVSIFSICSCSNNENLELKYIFLCKTYMVMAIISDVIELYCHCVYFIMRKLEKVNIFVMLDNQ